VAYLLGGSEAAIHKKLHKFRVAGEWFLPAPEVINFVALWSWCDEGALAGCGRVSPRG
jgi:hypothetical protein